MATQVVQAVAITATVSMIVSGMLFYFLYKFTVSRRLKRTQLESSFHREAGTPLPRIEFRQHCGAIKGLIVEEEGLDMLYVRRLQGGHQFSPCFSKVGNNPMGEEIKRMNSSSGGENPIQETPILQEPMRNGYEVEVKKPLSIKQIPSPPPPPPLPPPPSVSEKGKLKLTPPPGPPKLKPVPPPLSAKKSGLTASSKPPIPPRGYESRQSKMKDSAEESTKENGVQMKLKPLHWDKVTANADHSMVWNEINDGSFRFEDDLMESLFGYTTPNPKPTTAKGNTSSHHANSNSNSLPPAQIFLLDPHRSQNTSIILKSLPISHKEIVDSLSEGRGLSSDTLEKLTKIRPTQDEITKILDFNGNPARLADAESFLHHILKAVPSAFIRLNAMLFRSTYDPEISHLKKSLQALELGCKELRTGRVFFKLLEAILKAGNRLNAGTNRGDAKGFDLAALRRLSDVKSTDGKTTLLYFVVEQVARAEGKRCLDNRNPNKNSNSEGKGGDDDDDGERTALGLTVLESLNGDFANVKKAAGVDHEGLAGACSVLAKRVDEIKRVLNGCGDSESGGFSRVMRGFLEDCEGEVGAVREEQRRVMEIVRKTTAFYQAKEKFGGSDVNSLQLFVIVRDFLNNVDRVCSEIGKKLKKGKVGSGGAGSSPPTIKSPVRFQNLEVYFRAQRGEASSSSEDDF